MAFKYGGGLKALHVTALLFHAYSALLPAWWSLFVLWFARLNRKHKKKPVRFQFKEYTNFFGQNYLFFHFISPNNKDKYVFLRVVFLVIQDIHDSINNAIG